jgi:hypothetical protein
MEVNGQFHAPAALTSGKEAPVRIGLEAGRAPEPIWTLCPLGGIKVIKLGMMGGTCSKQRKTNLHAAV